MDKETDRVIPHEVPNISDEGDALTVLWRGSLASCNYGCDYCPFAKTKDDREALRADRQALAKFTQWAQGFSQPVSVLFTPWGEALIHGYYRDGMVELSHAKNIQTIAIQTNLSCSVAWVSKCDLTSAAFWCTYHPGETDRGKFVKKIATLEEMGARYSVGVVGLKEHFREIQELRAELPKSAYLWVNAYKREPDYYDENELQELTAIDPLFPLNNRSYTSFGRQCRAGAQVISVLYDGTARRCHFLEQPIGNIYETNFEKQLRPRACTAASCRCHIGYSHLKDLDLPAVYGDGFLERRPSGFPAKNAATQAMQRFDEPES